MAIEAGFHGVAQLAKALGIPESQAVRRIVIVAEAEGLTTVLIERFLDREIIDGIVNWLPQADQPAIVEAQDVKVDGFGQVSFAPVDTTRSHDPKLRLQ